MHYRYQFLIITIPIELKNHKNKIDQDTRPKEGILRDIVIYKSTIFTNTEMTVEKMEL